MDNKESIKTRRLEDVSININTADGQHLTTIRIPSNPNILMEIRNIFNGNEYRRFPPCLSEPILIVDIGANLGAAAIFFKVKFPNAKIVSFEPSRSTFSYLHHNVSNLNNIRIFPFGLYRHDCISNLYVGHRSSLENSLFPNEGTTLNSEAAEFRRASSVFSKLNIDHISILKIDTEGAEVSILRDIEAWFEKIDLIFVEYHSEEDRIEIDRMLNPQFCLIDFSFIDFHRGLMTYLFKNLTNKIPNFNLYKITRSNA